MYVIKHLRKLRCRKNIVFFVSKNCVTLGQITAPHTPNASNNFQLLFDIPISDKILGNVMKGIVCQTFRFCRICVNVRVGGGRFDPPPLLGLMNGPLCIYHISWKITLMYMQPHFRIKREFHIKINLFGRF